jgi:Protein of unknown function (DUF2634).
MTLFPSIQPQAITSSSTLKLYSEVQWDYENNSPVFKKGSPIIVTGKEAVLTWAWKALNTPRYKHAIYTWNYGNESETLIGQQFSSELKQSEAARYVKECLLINPYITSVSNVTVAFSDCTLHISCTINTIYGEVSMNV